MTNLNLIILSYHKFVEEPSDYRFSRTYDQFYHDIRKKVYDMVTIDDGMRCQIQACDMLRAINVRAKLFICTSLVGTEGYCTWDELRELSKWHDIENHSHEHIDLTKIEYREVYRQIGDATKLIGDNIGKRARYFVPPWNYWNGDVEKATYMVGVQLITNRENILNISK